ncbi:MAG: hypothetical protein A3F90_16725 [Deltaproteobacteria bacterium RIFCSPLOWO2_12_FULL_60_19]|nr:MAG: hypothetical protein A3F90_16725 [Deltaproteobacteria bacterium RIFCSPLOWO2_12_FULL_60_19]
MLNSLSLRWKQPLAERVDFYFLALRLFTVVGGWLWYLVVPYDPLRKEILIWLLSLYSIYSCLLYAGIFRWPDAVRSFYLTTLAVDLIFAFTLVRYIGQVRGSYFLAFYLLVAVHSFYFGLKTGLAAALLSSIFYLAAHLDRGGLSIASWPDFALRIIFLFLITCSLGLLAEREKKARKIVEELNQELSRKNTILEMTYRHLSIGKLIGEISESINGPCGVMAIRAEVLMQEARERGFAQEFISGLEVIHRSSHQLAQVTKALSTLSKQKGFEMKPLDFNQLVEENLLLMERGLKERGIKLEKRLMPRLPLIMGDPYELKGVLINLISNAIDALPHGGTIEIATRLSSEDGGVVECAITDNGVGISKDNLERIFNPFFSTKHNTGGIGLGLSTSLSVIKKHNGLISVKSSPGEGSFFSISLPAHHP